MQESSTFRVTFHRHDPRVGDGRIMVEHMVASDFADAVRCATMMRRAMQDADPSRTYKVASVSNEGLVGKITASGWMTEEEFSAHVAEKAGKK